VLEGFGGSAGLPVWVEEIVEAGAVAVFVDNSGFVWAHRRGSSRDEYIWTLAKFMVDFGRGLGVKVRLFHTGRRTSGGERIADALSKGNMKCLIRVRRTLRGYTHILHYIYNVLVNKLK
jgi:hypothetical protein